MSAILIKLDYLSAFRTIVNNFFPIIHVKSYSLYCVRGHTLPRSLEVTLVKCAPFCMYVSYFLVFVLWHTCLTTVPAKIDPAFPGFIHPNLKFMIQYFLDFLDPGYPGFFENSTGRTSQPPWAHEDSGHSSTQFI
jgi:hypothetical protein